MAIPDYQRIMLPLLYVARDGGEHSFRDAVEQLAVHFALNENERKELLPSGRYPIFDDRAAWAKTFLTKAGLVESIKRGVFKITERGLEVVKENRTEINVNYLKRFPEFMDFQRTRNKNKTIAVLDQEKDDVDAQTPEESIEYGFQKLKNNLAQEILEHIKKCSPTFFESLVVELLVKMGYGGSRKDAGERIGKSGDGGIDGIIKEDKLGLDSIYIQAKKWEGTVGRPEIQKFAGALQGFRAKKGVFITTSNFSKEAEDYASKIENKIVLIDGELLTQLMIDYNIGVSSIASYEIKKIDSDYFSEE